MRRVPRFTIALIGVILASMLGMSALSASSSEESSFASKINNERSGRGLGTLRWNEDLAQVARRHSRRMADQNNLYHNPNLRSEVDGWEVVGENVGYGPSVEDLHSAFMASQSHRANILDGDYTHIGTGTVWKDGTLWVTEVFMRPLNGSSSGSSGSSGGSSTQPPPRRRSAPKPKKAPARPARPAVPPSRQPVAPVAAPPAPAPAADGSASDLTRLMVSNLLSTDDPAVGTVGLAEVYFAGDQLDEAAIIRLSFRAFSELAGRVNRALLAITGRF